MKKFLKFIYNWIKGIYYAMLLIYGILGINQVVSSKEPKDINILIVIVSLFAIGYGIKNLIKFIKEI